MCSNSLQSRSVTHVIFDFFGLMVDSEMWIFENLNKTLNKYGKSCSLDVYSRLVGINILERKQAVIEQFQLTCDPNHFYNQWIESCSKDFNNLKLMPGVKPLIEHLKKHNIPQAVTFPKKFEFYACNIHLKDIFEDGKYFNHITHYDEIETIRLKPHPDIFQYCASEFSPVPDPQNVLVFDDTILGISAATAAGMQSVLVWDKRFGESVHSNATVTINSLEEFKPEWFGLPQFQSTTNQLESYDYFDFSYPLVFDNMFYN